MKYAHLQGYVIIILVFSFCTLPGGEELHTELNRNKSHLVENKNAKQKIAVALNQVFTECPDFAKSGLNPGLNWAMMMSSDNCGPYSSSEPDFFKGCADKNFANEDSLNICLASIAAMHCNVSGNNINSMHFLAFGICAEALQSDMKLPMLFF